jgi:hypothetical protein
LLRILYNILPYAFNQNWKAKNPTAPNRRLTPILGEFINPTPVNGTKLEVEVGIVVVIGLVAVKLEVLEAVEDASGIEVTVTVTVLAVQSPSFEGQLG